MNHHIEVGTISVHIKTLFLRKNTQKISQFNIKA